MVRLSLFIFPHFILAIYVYASFLRYEPASNRRDAAHAPRGITLSPVSPFANATQSDVDEAQKIVSDAIEEMIQKNAARYVHPIRNGYKMPRHDAANAKGVAPAPLLKITDKISKAAALVAEVQTAKEYNGSALIRRL